jgi:hypothetical protein
MCAVRNPYGKPAMATEHSRTGVGAVRLAMWVQRVARRRRGDSAVDVCDQPAQDCIFLSPRMNAGGRYE